MTHSNHEVRTVLIVDDEAPVRSLMRDILEHAGYEVHEASNGKEAEEKLAARATHLVITDLVMPEREGIETIRSLRKRYPNLGIIAVSGAFEGRFLRGAELLGADAALMKPFDPGALVEAVKRVLAARA